MRNLLLLTFSCSILLLAPNAKTTGDDTVSEKQPVANSTPQMIAVEVKLIEVSNDKFEKLGVEINTFNGQRTQKVDGLMAFQHMSSAESIGFVESL